MEFTFVSFITYVVIPLFITMGSFILRNFMNRIEKLENRSMEQITETEARQILSDKLDPVKETLTEIKKQIEKITEFLIK